MKKKGFILMETIVVIVVISVSLITIFSSYNKILTKVKNENRYDTSEYIYITKYIKDYLKEKHNLSISPQNISNEQTDIINYADIYKTELSGAIELYKIKKIHIVNLGNGTINNKTHAKFDGYMIDYLRKLDVKNGINLIIIEYERQAMSDGEYKTIYGSSDRLYDTYIASLEW